MRAQSFSVRILFHLSLSYILFKWDGRGTCTEGKYADPANPSNCLDCAQKLSNCNACDSAIVCTKCSDGYFVSSNSCQKCPSECSLCSAIDYCQKCQPEYKFYLPLNRTCTLCGNQATEMNYTDDSNVVKCVSRPIITSLTGTSAIKTDLNVMVSIGCSDPSGLHEISGVTALWIASSNQTLVTSQNLKDLSNLLSKNGPKTAAVYSDDVVMLYSFQKMDSINQGRVNVSLNLRAGLIYKFAYYCVNKWEASAKNRETLDIDYTQTLSKKVYVGITFQARLGKSMENKILCSLESMLGLTGKGLVSFSTGGTCNSTRLRMLQSNSDPRPVKGDTMNTTYFFTILPDLNDSPVYYLARIKRILGTNFASEFYKLVKIDVYDIRFFSEDEILVNENKAPDFTSEEKYTNVSKTDLITLITMKDAGYLFFAVMKKQDDQTENYTLTWSNFVNGKSNDPLKFIDYFISIYCQANEEVYIDVRAMDSSQAFYSFVGTMGFDKTFTKSPIKMQIFVTDDSFIMKWHSIAVCMAIFLISILF